MNITIDSKGASDISVSFGSLSIELQEVDMSFLEDLPSDIIVRNHNNDKLLDAMDADEVYIWLESNFDITIKDNK